ncbi:unnamed protein product, partial [Cladocopium goreaui]
DSLREVSLGRPAKASEQCQDPGRPAPADQCQAHGPPTSVRSQGQATSGIVAQGRKPQARTAQGNLAWNLGT